MSKRAVAGIAGGGGKYPKLVVDVKSITKGVIRPMAGTNLATDSVISLFISSLPDQMIR
jgi:hypothetical protein